MGAGAAGRPGRSGSRDNASSDGLGCNEEISDDGDDEEEEGECSAPFCRQPVAEQICWVQCDHCQEWFHCLCVGLTKEYAEKIESYNCKSCKAVGVASAGGALQKKGVVVRAERTRVSNQVRESATPPGGSESTNSVGEAALLPSSSFANVVTANSSESSIPAQTVGDSSSSAVN